MSWLPIIIVSVQVTLVAALALLAGRLLSSAAHRHSVLLAALLCILASPLFYAGMAWSGLSMNLLVFIPAPRESAVADPLPTDSTLIQQEDTLPTWADTTLESPEGAIPDAPAANMETPLAPADLQTQYDQVNRFPLRSDYIVAGLWLAGTMLSLAGLLRSQWKTTFILQAARPVGEGIDASIIVEAERRLSAVRPLRVATTGKVAGPAVVGIFQPWILIPARYLETLSQDELLQVLIHEGAHAQRRDPLVALLQRIGGAMFWWHPLVHLVNRELTRAREEVCDNFVLTCTEPETYGATLLRLATLSPAMARLPLAIGMFDGRGKLEERIRGLLDSRRKILTQVRLVTGAAMFGTFALFSVLVAAARVGAQDPADAPPVAPEAAPAEAVDAKEFRLILTYHGEADKPFYNLVLNVPPPGAQQANRFSLAQQISEEQAGKLIKHLKQSQFFEHAKVTKTQDDPTTGPQYLLRVRQGESHFEETLGWDVGTLIRLDGLRKTLNGEAAQAMDQLLARLEGQRKVWESGEVVNDLKTTLSTDKETFGTGRPIPIKLELTNVGQQDRQYGHHHFIRSGSEIVVTDEHGRQVPYLGGGAGLTTRETTIKPGETKVIESCDLSDFYYLRRHGLYTVAFRNVPVYASGVPASNAVRFRVTADAGVDDGDPMGKLLPLRSRGGTLIGTPNAQTAVRPGRSRAEAPGYQFVFVGQNGGLKGVKGIKESNFRVWLWLTTKAAEAAELGDFTYLPDSEYLGPVARWHAYFYASPEALEVWPTARHDVMEAIKDEAKPKDEKLGAADEHDYRLLHDRYRALILAAAHAGKKEEVTQLTDKFNESIGGKLLFAQVTLRVGPIAEHEPMFSRFFDPQRQIGIGKLGFATSAKPIVSQNHDGQDVVLVATNPLGGNKWPDDLQVTLVMDNVLKKDLRKPPAEPKWSAEKNGLRTRITAEKQTFPAGTPIPLKLEIENVGRHVRKFETSAAPHNGTLIVTDEAGRPVPYLAGLSQVPVRSKNLEPGAREEMKAFDLSESFYLRRPGRYSVRWPGGTVLRIEAPMEPAKSPETAPFEFDITPNSEAAADGDPIGRLLPLVKEKWWLTGTGKTGKVHPGSNREEVPGCLVFFHYNPTGYKPDSGVVFLWLTEKAAAEQPDKAESPTASKYLGKVDRWHVYTYRDAIGSKAWPTANDDIKKALDAEPKHAAAKPALKAPQWGQVMDGFRARLSAGKQTFDAGEPIPVRLEIENRGPVGKEYHVPVIPANQTLRVVDERGRDVLPLLDVYQVAVGASRPENIKAGGSIEIAAFDLGECFYLRRPGRYKVSGSGKPSPAEFEFEVIPNPARAAADGDPIGRLLPLVKEGWWLGAGPRESKFRPGSNWGETTGRIARFVKNPPASNGEGLINIWLANERAAEVPVSAESSIPTSEYLGQLDRWHVYWLASETTLAAWPTAKEDIKKALFPKPNVSLEIESKEEFARAEDIVVIKRITNLGKVDLPAPETVWSISVLLDGKEYKRLAKFIGDWNGPGLIIPDGVYSGGFDLSEYGVDPASLRTGKHTLALKLGEIVSNELTFTVGDE